MAEQLTFKPMKLETVVVMRGDAVVGTIRRYRNHGVVQVRVPGILTPASHPGQSTFKTVGEAKKRLLELDPDAV